MNDAVTVADSLFLMKFMLAKWVFASIQVMKYLKFLIDGSKGPHRSETWLSGARCLVCRRGGGGSVQEKTFAFVSMP